MSDQTPTEARRNLNSLADRFGSESLFNAATNPDSPDADRLDADQQQRLRGAVDTLDNSEVARKLVDDPNRGRELDFGTVSSSEASITVVSRARPLTPSANDDLQDYDPMRRVTAGEIENPPLGVGDDTLVGYELGERPPEDVIDRYQLDVEQDTLPDNTPPTSNAVFYDDPEALLATYDTPPEPSDDPAIRYLHPGKEYNTPTGLNIVIDRYAPNALTDVSQDLNGVVVFRSLDNTSMIDESESDLGGVTTSVLSEFDSGPSEGVWTGQGVLSGVRELELLEDNPGSYGDIYFDFVEGRGIEETPRGTAEMQSAGFSNSGTDVPLRLDVFADRDGSTEFPYTIPNADGNGVPIGVVRNANEAIVDDLGDENQYTMNRPVGVARFDDSRDPPRFIAFDPADALPFDLLDGDDSGTSMFEVVVGRQGSINVYEVEGVSRLSGLRNDARGIVDDEIGDARQYQRGETVGQVRILGTDDGKMVDRFDPRGDLVAAMDYDTNIDPRRQSTRDVTASDISFRFDNDGLNRRATNTALEILRAEFGEPTEFADNTVVGQVAFEQLSPDEYIVSGVNQRLEGEPDDQRDVLETDLGGLSPEVEDDDDDDQPAQERQRSTQGTLTGGTDPLDPGEFPTEPDAEAQRRREQLRREEQQQDLEGDAPEFDPAADRREQERRERRAERTEEQLAEDQVDLLGENIESDDVLPADTVDDDDDNQPGLSAFGGDDGGNGGSGN